MPRTIIIGDYDDAVGGVLTLRGGEQSHLDTIYVLDLPADLPELHPVWNVSVRVHDGDGDAIIELSKGDDEVFAGAGSDWIKSGCGDDLVFAGRGEDMIMLGCGDDVCYGGAGADLIAGGYGSDLIFGGADGDLLYAGKGDDEVRGSRDDDTLFGQRGDDVLRGGEGSDILIGGLGADEFHVRSLDLDAVLDFDAAEGDVLVVDGVDRTAEADQWIGQGGVVAMPVLVAEAPQVPASDGATG